MNDKTNFTGYSQTLGLATGDTTMTTAISSDGRTTINYDWNQFNGGSGTTLSNESNYNSISTLTINQNNMNKQTKVAVFTVKRNEDNKVVSSTFVKEFWVEIKNGGSVELAAAKQLDKDYDPDTTIIREIHICNF